MIETGTPIGEDDLQALLDDRLDPAGRALVEAALAADPEAAARMAADRRIREGLRARLAAKAAEPIPARLRIASIEAEMRRRRMRRLTAVAAGFGLFLLGGLGGVATDRWLGSPAGEAPAPTAAIAEDAGAAFRTFVVEVVHPVEVDATREAHLMQWLSKRLGRRLVAPDLTTFGWRLMGGRLLPVETGAAAQLMYEDGSGRRLTVYIRATDGAETAFRFRDEGGTATCAWIDGGFGFAITAPLDRARLLPLAEAVYHRLEAEAPAGRG